MIVFSGFGSPPNGWKALLKLFPCALEVFSLAKWRQACNIKRNIGTVQLPT